MWLVFPQFRNYISEDGLYELINRPMNYAFGHFSEYSAMMIAESQAEARLIESSSDAFNKNYEPFTDYVLSIIGYYGYQGMCAAGQEFYCGAVTQPEVLRAQADQGIYRFLDSKIMTDKRTDAVAGIQRNSQTLQKPMEEREYLIARARHLISTCYLSVIAGYTFAAVNIESQHHCDWDADAADRLQKALLQLRLDDEIDTRISLIDAVNA